MNTTIEKLKEKQAKELAEAEREEKVLAMLPIKPERVSQYPLYGSEGMITFGTDYTYRGKPVTLLELAELLEALPPLPMVKAKGTFTRFLGETWADSDANKDKDKETLESIFPVTLKIKSVAGYSVEAHWLSEIDGETWEVAAILANPHDLARVHSRRVEFMGGHRYENARLEINSKLNPTEGYWNTVRWGRGSEDWPNDFTAYHNQYDENPVEWAKKAFSTMKETQFEAAVI